MTKPRTGKWMLAVVALSTAALVAPLISSCAPRAGGAGQHETVKFRTTDGWTIVGERYAATGKPAGSVILLHQRGGSAADWAPLCAALQKAGITALAIDQRGAGQSTAGPGGSGENAPWDTSGDIAAAIGFIHANGKVGLAGASYGANNALIYAAAHPAQVAGVALFSPGENYHGLAALPAAASYRGSASIYHYRQDEIAGNGPSLIDARLRGAHQLWLYDGSGHGTDLLATDAKTACVRFFKDLFTPGR